MSAGWRIAIVLLLLGLLLLLQRQLWFGASGERAVTALQAQVQAQKEKNLELAQRNDALAAEVQSLKAPESGSAAIEERARDEFGLIKPGETFYRVVSEPVRRQGE